MRDIFARRPPPGQAGKVKGWITQRLQLTDADLVTVAELACHEPDCPPVETVMTVHGSDGERHSWRLHKPIAKIEEPDIEKALLQGGGMS